MKSNSTVGALNETYESYRFHREVENVNEIFDIYLGGLRSSGCLVISKSHYYIATMQLIPSDLRKCATTVCQSSEWHGQSRRSRRASAENCAGVGKSSAVAVDEPAYRKLPGRCDTRDRLRRSECDPQR